ncbi:hypothetical protein N183_38795 [Sinorhizobium sp. Sb3]|nr:hypothetical protein N183_38795 [Sinorhizobium sp. Sb3]
MCTAGGRRLLSQESTVIADEIALEARKTGHFG